MKKTVTITELQVGMYVSAITKSRSNLVVKSQGMIRSQATIDSLLARGILEFEIDLSKSDYQEPEQSQQTEPEEDKSKPIPFTDKPISFEQQQKDLAVADRLYTEAREIHNRFIRQLQSGQAPDFNALNKLSNEIIDSVFDNADVLACLVMLKESNDYLVEHALNCSILMSIFAKHKGFSQAEVEDLTLAGLLMDCGMALLPKELVSSTEKFTEADLVLMRTHVDIGYEIAERFGDIPPIALDVIANHHERINGLGYPKQKTEDEISLYAQMSAIVDTYDAMLTDRPFRSSASAQNILESLQNDDGFDKQLVNEFISAIGLFPVGSLVHLQSGKLAIVVQRNKQNPLKPTVMAFYSIRGKHHTEIKRIDLKRTQTDKIVGSVTPEEFDINLPHFFRTALLPF
jgi:HD-GYP domain-containing protein (c-di-GMP phosphodiesterase class II)